MIRQPPRSPLFPYPTLSRSLQRGQTPPQKWGCRARRIPRSVEGAAHSPEVGRALEDVGLPDRVAVGRPGAGVAALEPLLLLDRDRKSTRLNSSHANISYAVF